MEFDLYSLKKELHPEVNMNMNGQMGEFYNAQYVWVTQNPPEKNAKTEYFCVVIIINLMFLLLQSSVRSSWETIVIAFSQ